LTHSKSIWKECHLSFCRSKVCIFMWKYWAHENGREGIIIKRKYE
jgi:hypothetical protein